ncbi:hypothetical protein [Clostridium botulinum]|uniref:hypothetical protein n=1 Tax=Clostridium botulinum TaxID=1491 RepID=UPI000773CDDE|nr:hypothetical protein [Clostridium botulinum]MBY6931874.1 hypothetical protein [Clostridium botulinum]NFG20560.1 hypothetical protein [Clostridium botulinum]NFO81118.1 hypothetical protein [Clostridium botulinum]
MKDDKLKEIKTESKTTKEFNEELREKIQIQIDDSEKRNLITNIQNKISQLHQNNKDLNKKRNEYIKKSDAENAIEQQKLIDSNEVEIRVHQEIINNVEKELNKLNVDFYYMSDIITNFYFNLMASKHAEIKNKLDEISEIVEELEEIQNDKLDISIYLKDIAESNSTIRYTLPANIDNDMEVLNELNSRYIGSIYNRISNKLEALQYNL